MKKENYRKIWENEYGKIPKEPNGRSYQIHHIDGNHENNEITNLQCVTLQEHYEIHLRQGDKKAAARLAMALKLSPIEISELASAANKERVEKRIHNLQKRPDGSSVSKDRLSNPNYVNPFARRPDGSSVTSDRNQSGPNNPQYDPKVYKFKNLKTGDTIECTQYELRIKFNLHASNLSQVIGKNPRMKSIKGWALVD